MHFTKTILADIEKCYSATATLIKGEPFLFFAGEGNGSLQAFHGDGFNLRDQIWTGGGGTMSITPLKEDPPMLLASRGFYSMVEAQTSTIEIIRFSNNQFSHQTIASLPYLHRFDVLKASDGVQYILAATIASYKENKEDWSHPGHLYWAKLPDDLNAPFEVAMTMLPGDFYMNHGFCKTQLNGEDIAFTASLEGVFSVLPPGESGEEWTVSKILDEPVSDIAVCDIDMDGEPEIAAILPFHGNSFRVYKKKNGEYAQIYSQPDENDFYHTVISGTVNGKPVFVGGARQLEATLFLLSWDKFSRALISQELDRGCGPSNAFLFNTSRKDILLCANRQIAQAAIYEFYGQDKA